MEINDLFLEVSRRLFAKDASIVLNFIFDSIVETTWPFGTTNISTLDNIVIVPKTAFWVREYLCVVLETVRTYDYFRRAVGRTTSWENGKWF